MGLISTSDRIAKRIGSLVYDVFTDEEGGKRSLMRTSSTVRKRKEYMATRTYECFCGNEVYIRDRQKNTWTLAQQHLIKSMEWESDDFFLYNHDLFKADSQKIITCPVCMGLSRFELHGEAFHNMYYLPEKHLEPFHLEKPKYLKAFHCPCGEAFDTTQLQNQWMMINASDESVSEVMIAMENKGAASAYYEALYNIGLRVFLCPSCEGITTVDCDAEGRGLVADYCTLQEVYVTPPYKGIKPEDGVHYHEMVSRVTEELYW